MNKIAVVELSENEKIIANTGLGIMYQLIADKHPIMMELLKDHPFKHLLTLESIDKLHYKFGLETPSN